MPDKASDSDRYCLNCGYNLRGLSGDELRCPECGRLNPPCTRYTVIRHFWGFGLRFSVFDDARRRVFTFKARQLTLGRDYDLFDARGEKLLRVVQQHGTIMTAFDVIRDRRIEAVLRHKALSIRHQKFTLAPPEGDGPTVECVCAGKHWNLRRDGEFVAEVTKPWFAWLYAGQRVDIAAGEDAPLIFGAILAIDAMLGQT